MSRKPEKPNLFFRLTTLMGAVFVVTILSLVAAMFGDPEAPPARFLDAHGMTLIGCEVAAILAIGLAAMAVDRRRTLREMRLGGSRQVSGHPAVDPPAESRLDVRE